MSPRNVDLPIETRGQVFGDRLGLPEFLVHHVLVVGQDHRDGLFDAQTDDVERLTGSAAQDLATFARENAELFESPGALTNV